jgi:pyrroloquinoline quinone biosynthesis protein D
MKVARNPDILWREEDEPAADAKKGLAAGEDVEAVGTSVLFSDGVMLSLNILGTEIWKRCDGRDVEDIVAELQTLFDVEPQVLRSDVKEFLAELEQKGFIRYDNNG